MTILICAVCFLAGNGAYAALDWWAERRGHAPQSLRPQLGTTQPQVVTSGCDLQFRVSLSRNYRTSTKGRCNDGLPDTKPVMEGTSICRSALPSSSAIRPTAGSTPATGTTRNRNHLDRLCRVRAATHRVLGSVHPRPITAGLPVNLSTNPATESDVMDYRKMYDDKEHFYAYDLDGRERTLEIARVVSGELTGEKNRKSKKPMVSFVGEQKKLALNKTNGKVIAKMYGKDTETWVGEFITIYPTTTEFGGETVDCIRVRPERPSGSSGRQQSSRRSNGSRSAKDDRQATFDAEASQLAAHYLVDSYAKCRSEERLAELKTERGKVWATLGPADREDVGAAALAAKERIDADAALSANEPVDQASDAQEVGRDT